MGDEQNTQKPKANGQKTNPNTATTAELKDKIAEPDTKKKLEAILAMEGEEGRARREAEEKKKLEAQMLLDLEKQKSELNNKLSEIGKKKDEFELRWIDLNDKKEGIQKILDPILSSEIKTETEEQEKNKEEHAVQDIKQRQEIERQRQALEIERQKIEQEKWGIEDKIYEVDQVMQENKASYQTLIKEEYKIIDDLSEIDKKIESIKQ
jgi:hypothetical protein